MYVWPTPGRYIGEHDTDESSCYIWISPKKHIPGLWTHETKLIHFSLCVDKFPIKYTDKAYAEHLLYALRQQYTISTDGDAKLYSGVKMYCSYKLPTYKLSIMGYMQEALLSFLYQMPKIVKPNYGQRLQLIVPDNTSS